MNRNVAWGAGALLTIAAVLGISTRTPKAPVASSPGASETKKNLPSKIRGNALSKSVCVDPEKILQEFLLADEADVVAPDSCYSENFPNDADAEKSRLDSQQRLQTRTSRLKFIVAILPDPLHTHLSLLFDRKIEAIQQAAQDAGYDYDSSWLPWETDEHTFTHLTDQDEIEERKDAREDQPGLILFRSRSDKTQHPPKEAGEPFQDGLAVFVVGEEATRGIHRRQFQNAAAWIAALRPQIRISSSIAILGPTFSGSLPSLAELMADPNVQKFFNYAFIGPLIDNQVRIYSGSISGKEAVDTFLKTSGLDEKLNGWNIHFYSFIESDDRILTDYCDYLASEGLHRDRVAIISEDETAYGIGGIQKPPVRGGGKKELEEDKEDEEDQVPPQNSLSSDKVPCSGAVRLFYPRDISALRAAYQAQSIFSSPNSQESDTQHKSLSTDLADPAGEAHDTVRSYGGNQTPLAQEAQLLGIVSILHDHRSEYLIIRSSNTLDQLFLANFFRRTYPEGRIVIRGPDTLFLRERGEAGISGVMMLSTYPLIPWDWRNWLDQSDHPIHRVFGEETVEGTYVAARFLVQEEFKGDKGIPKPLDYDWSVCSTEHPERCFVPPNHYPDFSIPDYKAPFWVVPKECQITNENLKPTDKCEQYFRPSTWISVLGRGNFYPLAAFTRKGYADTTNKTEYTQEPPVPITEPPQDNVGHKRTTIRGLFDIPLGMKTCLLVILAFCAFHVWCCWTASFTAKPAFRAHFAATPAWFAHGQSQHPTLIMIGSVVVAFIVLTSAWGCGVFCNAGLSLAHRVWIWLFLSIGLFAALGAVLANQQAMYRLNTFGPKQPKEPDRRRYFILDWESQSLKRSVTGFLIAIGLFIAVIAWLDKALNFQDRLPTYWRSMNLNSGVSPLVPLLVLFGGIYMWFWYSLHGLALFGIDRPQLPGENSLFLKDDTRNVLKDKKDKHEQPLPYLRMFSQENAECTERSAIPLERPTWVAAVLILVTFAGVAFGAAWGVPLRSLGANVYAVIFFFLFAICISWTLAEAWQLLRVWRGLKRLLNFLDRIALRRTMSALQGFSWGNVWRMSGNVLDVRYKLLSRQIETLNHLKASFDEFESGAHDLKQWDDYCAMASCHKEIEDAQKAMRGFAPVYAANYDKNDFAQFDSLQTFQVTIARLVGKLITDVLIPAWRKETESLMKEEAKEGGGAKTDSEAMLVHLPKYIRNTEELVCITYLGFAQNILGRIRTMALEIVWLFVAITISVSTYPFDPRPILNKTLVFLFLALGAAVTFVYAEMYRDSTLSRVTNTTPGELGTEFWFKIIGFAVGPLIGLSAYIFPGITDFLLSWLQPGMMSLK